MTKNLKLSSLQLMLGICFAGIFILAACSTSASPEPTQAVEVKETQPQEEPPTQALTETATAIITEEGIPAPALEQASDETSQEVGYPAPEDQLPTPVNQTGGYPAPENQLPTPGNQTGGYPSPGEENPPPVKTELQATNPSSVNLASGELQLVEFFAFW
jgi:hypothetical protein